MKKLIWFLLAVVILQAEQECLIITHSFNRPDFIEIQEKCFKRFFKDPYKFVVFSDAPDLTIDAEIQRVCEKLGIMYVRVPQEIHVENTPAQRSVDSVQYSLELLGFDHDGPVMMIDSDMFCIQDFSFQSYMKNHVLSGIKQYRGASVSYITVGLVFFDMARLPDKRLLNFNCGWVDGVSCDGGGYTHYYFQKHPDLAFLPTKNQIDLWNGQYYEDYYEVFKPGRIMNSDQTIASDEFPITEEDVLARVSGNAPLEFLINQHPDNIQFYLDFTFLHYRCGSNWNQKEEAYHRKKTEIFHAFLERIFE